MDSAFSKKLLLFEPAKILKIGFLNLKPAKAEKADGFLFTDSNDLSLTNFFSYIQKWYIQDQPPRFSNMLYYTDNFNIENQFIRTNNIMEGRLIYKLIEY